MTKPATLFALLLLGAVLVGGYMVMAPDRPLPPYLLASLN